MSLFKKENPELVLLNVVFHHEIIPLVENINEKFSGIDDCLLELENRIRILENEVRKWKQS